MLGDTICKNTRSRLWNIIVERKSYTFENPKTAFMKNKKISYNSKYAVYVIECSKCKNNKYTGYIEVILNYSRQKSQRFKTSLLMY